MREDYSTYLPEKEPNMSYAADELAESLDEGEIASNQEPLSDD